MKESIISVIVEKYENIIAFLSGDILTTIFSIYFLNGMDWIHPIIKLGMAVVIGIVGGFSGLLGKDIYVWAKQKIK